MAKFDSKVDGNQVSGDEYNNIVVGVKNVITSSDQTIDTSNTQITKGIADYAAVGTFYTDSGAANAYVLSSIGSRLAPNAYAEGMEIRFRAGNSNTGASTVNVAGLGLKNIKKADGSTDIESGDISTDYDTRARYDGTAFRLSSLDEVNNFTVNGKFNIGIVSQTISSGAIAYSCGHMRLDTEGSAATDDLDTISGGTVGDRVVLSITNSARNVVIKDGTGNIQLFDNRDILLDFEVDCIELIYDGTNWLAINRIDSDFAASNTANGYTYLPNGDVLQWGTQTVAANTTSTITLPVAYTSLNKTLVPSYNSTNTGLSDACAGARVSLTQISLTNGVGNSASISYISIGR
jgi:hypothetical protein